MNFVGVTAEPLTAPDQTATWPGLSPAETRLSGGRRAQGRKTAPKPVPQRSGRKQNPHREQKQGWEWEWGLESLLPAQAGSREEKGGDQRTLEPASQRTVGWGSRAGRGSRLPAGGEDRPLVSLGGAGCRRELAQKESQPPGETKPSTDTGQPVVVAGGTHI